MRLAPVALLAAAIPLAAYGPALGGGFISDDVAIVADNPAVRSVGAALASFGRSYWFGLKSVEPYYRPLPIVSYAIDRAVWGGGAPSYHATNVALHAACALLVGLLVAGLARGRGPGDGAVAGAAAIATAFAAAHPIHSEPAAAIFGRPDLLASFLVLAFLNLAIRGRLAWALPCLALALFSKESAVGMVLLAPFALREGERASGRPANSGRALLAFLLPMTILSGYLVMRYRAIGLGLDVAALSRLDNPLVGAPGASRWLTPIAIVARYAGLWLWPARLCGDHGFDTVPLAGSLLDGHVVAGGAILLVGGAALVALIRGRSPLWIPLAAAALAFAPASNLVVLAPVLMAERVVYLPSLLVIAVLGALLAAGLSRLRSRAAVAAICSGATVVIVAAGVRTHARAGEFASDLTFYGSDVRTCPSSAKAQFNFGNALARNGREGEAVEAYAAATRIAPWLAVAHNNLGMSYLRLGKFRDAESAFREAVAQDPGLLSPHESLAGLLYQDGRLEESLAEAARALDLAPNPSDARQLRDLIRTIEGRVGRER
ncbi:MAG TPA: tetratricopeptide repeat protein [Verrucomicrobiae bacterium]|nr:tetratricopeptide repeat protein [Verrucomicrobiae bacterium]